MSYAADLHVHSRYAIGTSRTLDFETLTRWAKIKGIDLLASADFTHRDWFRETREKLIPCGDGLYEFDGVKFVQGPRSAVSARKEAAADASTCSCSPQVSTSSSRSTGRWIGWAAFEATAGRR